MPEDYPRTLGELERRFSDDGACRQYLFELRWPKGFRCPRCGQQDCWPISRGLWLCSACGMRLSRHPSRADGVVSSDVEHHEPKERDECPWPPAGSWAGQLQDGVV